MEDIKDVLCRQMHNFVKSYFKTLKKTPESLGFESKKDMMKQISTDYETAVWVISELSRWGFSDNYHDKFFVKEETEENTIYVLVDKDQNERYFIAYIDTNNKIVLKEKIKITRIIYKTDYI